MKTFSKSEIEGEVWLDIPGYEGEYQASNLGRIKSLKRLVTSINWSTRKPFKRYAPERILKPGKYTKSGHLSVALRRGTQGRPVHQLVMRTFVGEPPEGMEVLHINGDPTDNRLQNLRYGTRTENILDVYYQGKRWRKLSIEDVRQIRHRIADGTETLSAIGKDYGVSTSCISTIKVGRTYKWLK